jgi:phosphopantothenoylcysteine decarboxylase/phosphopantothenate--cysteine ligase
MNILVTAGPTREALDPVRFISNRSSGKMGYAVARAALGRGHAVRLITGPVALRFPRGARVVRVVSAAEMLRAVRRHLNWCDALVMAAAVCDWRPRRRRTRKLKKAQMPAALRLVRTADILKSIGPMKGGRMYVGFAAETGEDTAEAFRKLREKRLDLIALNDVSRRDAGFDVDTNRLTLISADGRMRRHPLMSKCRAAMLIVRWLEVRHQLQEGASPERLAGRSPSSRDCKSRRRHWRAKLWRAAPSCN